MLAKYCARKGIEDVAVRAEVHAMLAAMRLNVGVDETEDISESESTTMVGVFTRQLPELTS